MKKLVVFLVVIFSLSFIYALEVDFSCPSSVNVEEEFSCEIGFLGNYDVKVDLLCGVERCAQIWNGEFWGSTYYFVNGFSGNEVRLKIVENYNGNCEGKLRLRRSGTSGYDYEESFSIGVVGGVLEDGELDEESEEMVVNYNREETEIVELADKNSGGIVLNSGSEDGGEEIVYESKNEKIKNLAIYGFALFLIFVIVALVVGR